MSVSILEGPTLPTIPDPGILNTTVRSRPVAEAPQAVQQARNPLPMELGQALDTAVVLAVLLAIWVGTRMGELPATMDAFFAQRITLKSAVLVGGFMILWPRLLNIFRLYDSAPESRRDVLLRAMGASATGAVLAFSFPLDGLPGAMRGQAALAFFAAATAGTLAVRLPVWTLAAASARSRPKRRVLVVGSGPRAVKVAADLRQNADSYELLGFVDTVDDEAWAREMDAPRLGRLEQMEELLMHQVVDEVLIALPIKSCYTEIQHVIRVCERTGTESRYLADLFQASVARPRYDATHRFPVVAMKVFYDDYRLSIKRAIDIVGALAGLLLLSPLLIGIAIAVTATSPGPVLFAQERYGLNKRRFRMLKFRTMVPDAEKLQVELEGMNEAIGPIFKIKDDPRVTPVGRWLRKTSLDELPQLINVLMGQMSLVGPRPMAVRDVKLFDQAWFMRRFSAPPGMTGLWQVSGRSNLGFDDWVTLDLKYIDEWSLGMDLRILSKTVPVVLRGVGAV
ncbi:MAG TPA: sugar transferase [Longimicrobium sp.]|nr:sugar transferase [Longimicrobium sp.]